QRVDLDLASEPVERLRRARGRETLDRAPQAAVHDLDAARPELGERPRKQGGQVRQVVVPRAVPPLAPASIAAEEYDSPRAPDADTSRPVAAIPRDRGSRWACRIPAAPPQRSARPAAADRGVEGGDDLDRA